MRNRCEETYTFRKTTRFGNQVFGNLVSEIYMFRKPTRFGNCFESVAIIEFVWFLFRIAKVRLHQILGHGQYVPQAPKRQIWAEPGKTMIISNLDHEYQFEKINAKVHIQP